MHIYSIVKKEWEVREKSEKCRYLTLVLCAQTCHIKISFGFYINLINFLSIEGVKIIRDIEDISG